MTRVIKPPDYERKYPKRINRAEQEALEQHLREHPRSGDVMRGSGGLRKLRWGAGSKGKRGGVRVIYYFAAKFNVLILLDIYGKNERVSLTHKQIKVLSNTIKNYFQP